MKQIGILLLALALVITYSMSAKAELIERGGGLIYDTDLNITWYDYSYGGSGPVETWSWNETVSWAAGLNLGGVTGWRLPQNLPVNGSTYNYSMSWNGSTDRGYNISAPGSFYAGSKASEMAYLYYVELGNKGYRDINGNPQSGYGLVNKGPFENLLASDYWLGTEYGSDPVRHATTFGFGPFDTCGGQLFCSKTGCGYVYGLAVHDGDVVGQPVAAGFMGFPTSGMAPLNVNFTDESTGTVTSWNWDFGDGSGSDQQHPSHTYSYLGTYSVSLTVTGLGSDTETKTNYITVVSADAPDLSGGLREFHSYEFGDRIRVTIQTANTGNQKANRFNLAFYLSDDGITLAELLGEKTVIGGLKAGRVSNIAFTYKSDTSLSGRYIIVLIDSSDQVLETDETNNRVTIRIP